MKRKLTLLAGFTVVDLTLVMAVIAILMGLVTVNLITVQDKANINTSLNTLVADVKTQQIKAMVGENSTGDTPGRYGLLFDQGRYILFSGSSYTASESGNIVVDLPEKLIFDPVSLPQNQVVFEAGSGEIVGFDDGLHSVRLMNTSSNEERTIEFNRFGVITKGP